jgi:protein involved in polysaccharide export with SLBB domain
MHQRIWQLGRAALLVAGLTGPATAADYRLGMQDRLKVHSLEWPAIGGEYSVGPEGTVSLPLLGEVPASGLKPSALAQTIAQALRAKAGLNEIPNVSVEITQYRPFFVVGTVQRPGPYPFQPGMAVIHAISIAGGHFRAAELGAMRLERDAAVSAGDIQILTSKRQEQFARLLRIRAEIAGTADIMVDPNIQSAELARYVEQERAIMAARSKAFRDESENLDQQLKFLKDEIRSLEEQIAAEESQLQSNRRELDEVRSLIGRGLAPTQRQYLIERGVAQIEGKQRELESFISRARQTISRTELSKQALNNQRRSGLLVEQQQTEAQIAETDKRIQTARELQYEAEVITPGFAEQRAQDETVRFGYSLLRQESDGLREVPADELTAMQPGDIVKVQRVGRAVPPRAFAAPPGSTPPTDARSARAPAPM